MGGRPSVFLSYIRKEARDVADQLFDALGHRGYGVYLDQFSGVPGRIFPEQIAEELADKAVLLLRGGRGNSDRSISGKSA